MPNNSPKTNPHPQYSVCLLPKLDGTGGPATFQRKLSQGLADRGIAAHHDINDPTTRAVLVVGGTRQFGALLAAKRKGIRIVQRLDGMNWLHKRTKTGCAHFLRSERMNLQLSLIRRHFADAIVYQSAFTQQWWNRVFGNLRTPSTVIHNAVDLRTFAPAQAVHPPTGTVRLLVVEGSFYGGHQRDLNNAVEFANALAECAQREVLLQIAGRVPQAIHADVPQHSRVRIEWLGLVKRQHIIALDREAHLFFPAEINAACPNAVIEAMACGLPIISYATGSIPELVGENAGKVVPYGSDYWNLQPPQASALADAALQILNQHAVYRRGARERAEQHFGLANMVVKYHHVLFSNLES